MLKYTKAKHLGQESLCHTTDSSINALLHNRASNVIFQSSKTIPCVEILDKDGKNSDSGLEIVWCCSISRVPENIIKHVLTITRSCSNKHTSLGSE